MAQIVFNHVGGKPPFFDGTCYDYWKRKMKMYHLGTRLTKGTFLSTTNVSPIFTTQYVMLPCQCRKKAPTDKAGPSQTKKQKVQKKKKGSPKKKKTPIKKKLKEAGL